MSLSECIKGLVAEGKIRKGDGERAELAYSRHFNRLKGSMSMMAAAAEASELALRELEYDSALKKRQAVLQISTQQAIGAEIAAGDRYKTPLAIVERADAQRRAVLGKLHKRIEGVLAKHSRNLFGEARDKSGLEDIGREAFGEATGNKAAAELVEGWRAGAEEARLRFNRAGGAIGHRADWGLPQAHDMLKVRGRPYAEWRADILPKLDLGRMIDNATGQPFTPDSIEEALSGAYEAIRSDGWTKREAGSNGTGKLASRRADHRFFVFKSFDDWKAYQDKYGTGNLFNVMTGHLAGMARDIGLMEVMGPNPAATLKWMQDGVRKAAAEDADPGTGGLDRARSVADVKLPQLYDVVSGRMSDPVNQTWARRFGGVRAFLTSAFLGSASLSALTDVGFQSVTRRFNGLPVMGALTGYLKLLNPFSRADRRTAVRLGLIAEEASRMAAGLNRYIDDIHGPEIMLRLSDAVMRLSGLSPWTQAGRWAFGMEFLGVLADNRGKSLDQLDPMLRRAFERHGISAEQWDSARAAPPYKHKGAEFLDADAIEDEAAADAIMRMILTETDYAVPSATARARATLSFGQRPGTLGGEIIRNGALFKSFGVSMILTHGARMMSEKAWSRARYAAGLTITTTAIGALVLQLREITQMRDLKPMDDPAFIGKAILQGGGYGIFGDFIGAGARENRFGGGFAETLAGPVVGAAADFTRSAGKLATDAADPEKDANPGREAIKLGKRYVPGSSLWWARAAYERMLLDQIAKEIDPDYDQSWQRMEERAAEQGQEYYWRPGEFAPDRLPRIGETP